MSTTSTREPRDEHRPPSRGRADVEAGKRIFRLDEERWQAFQNLLDRPAAVKPRLRRLVADDIVPE